MTVLMLRLIIVWSAYTTHRMNRWLIDTSEKEKETHERWRTGGSRDMSDIRMSVIFVFVLFTFTIHDLNTFNGLFRKSLFRTVILLHCTFTFHKLNVSLATEEKKHGHSNRKYRQHFCMNASWMFSSILLCNVMNVTLSLYAGLFFTADTNFFVFFRNLDNKTKQIDKTRTRNNERCEKRNFGPLPR